MHGNGVWAWLTGGTTPAPLVAIPTSGTPPAVTTLSPVRDIQLQPQGDQWPPPQQQRPNDDNQSLVDALCERAASKCITCPVSGCQTTHRNRAALGQHLFSDHEKTHCQLADPVFLATHAYVRCPCTGCTHVLCLLPKSNANRQSSYINHCQQFQSGKNTDPASRLQHKLIRTTDTGGSWARAESTTRTTAIGHAPAGSLGADLAVVTFTAAVTTATTPPNATGAPATNRLLVPTGNAAMTAAELADAEYPIPLVSRDVDLSCLRSIANLNTHVRLFSRHLKAQGPPTSLRQQAELSATAVLGNALYNADVLSERGALGLFMYELYMAFTFFRPSTVVEPYTIGQLRRRAATFNEAATNGTLDLLWQQFTASCPITPVADIDLTHEHVLDYDSLPMPSPSTSLPDEDAVARNMAFKAGYGEWAKTWSCASPSPALDPRDPDTLRALIAFNNQVPLRQLTPEIMQDEPGVEIISFTTAQVKKVGMGLGDLRAAGTLPQDNRLIKMVLRHGGLEPITGWFNSSICRDRAHPLARDLIAGGRRAALIAKVDPVSKEVIGSRPLGITEKIHAFFWGCINHVKKDSFNHHFTHPMPEDVTARERRISSAESDVTAAAIELEAANLSASPARVRNATSTLAAAQAALTTASRRLKFVTNWCYAKSGTEKLAYQIRGWIESRPNGGLVSDDVAKMYQDVDRVHMFNFFRKRFPSLIPAFRFFYGGPSDIWIGGARVPIHIAADGTTTLAKSADAEGCCYLQSVIGGNQGCGGATAACCGTYHEDCCDAQRMNPDADMTAIADDFYTFHEECGEPLFKAIADKRACCLSGSNVHSNQLKIRLYSASGDLSRAPCHMPGSPNYTHADPIKEMAGRQRVTVVKVAGAFLGDPGACSAALLELLTAKMLPLQYVSRLKDTDLVRHAKQIAVYLYRIVATSIPVHWMRIMPPSQTLAAAEFVDAAIASALALTLDFQVSPPSRAALAASNATLATNNGGVGVQSLVRLRLAAFPAAYISAMPTILALSPSCRAALLDPAISPTTAEFHASWATLQGTLADVRTRLATLDSDTRTWVDGSVHAAFHPDLEPKNITFPPVADLFVDSTSTSNSRYSQRALAAVYNCQHWLDEKLLCTDFDTQNASHASVLHRESTRLVSCAQRGSGAWLSRSPDHTLRLSVVSSDYFVSACQRRLGLYISVLAPGYDSAAANGTFVSQHKRLGDHVINTTNKSHRHKMFLTTMFTAMASVSSPNTPSGTLHKGDRGDGTPAGKEEARRRHAHINTGTIPDIYRDGALPSCWETKCYTCFCMDPPLGNGSKEKGGAASKADGGTHAMGNTEEDLIVKNLGVPARGDRTTDLPLNRRTGVGWVAKTTDHAYADAISRKHPTTLLVAESTGAMSATSFKCIDTHAKESRAPAALDTTCYGQSRASHKSYLPHHVAAISAAIVFADTEVMVDAAAHHCHLLSIGRAP